MLLHTICYNVYPAGRGGGGAHHGRFWVPLAFSEVIVLIGITGKHG